jgi:uncharacterized protein DUF3987
MSELDNVATLIDRAKAYDYPGLQGWEPLVPLENILPAAQHFDYELLPASLAPWVKDSAYRLDNSLPDYIAAGAMVSLGALVGRRVGIIPKRKDDWMVVPNLWGAIIAPPSKRKSTQQTEGIRFVSAIDAEARKFHDEALSEWEVDNEVATMVAKATRDSAMTDLKKGKISPDEVKRRIEEVSNSADPEPIRERFLYNDSTIEKVSEIEAENPMGLLLYRDELSGWLTSLERPERAGDRSFYLEGWNGNGSFSCDRIGRGSLFIPSHTISVYGGIQPRKLEPYLRAMIDGHGDDGFLQRFQVMVYPEYAKGQMVDERPDMEARQRAERVYQAIADIPAHDGTEIPGVSFDATAQDEFIWWYQELLERVDNESSPFLQAHMGKYYSLMPSLALIIQLAENSLHGPAYTPGMEVDSFATSRAIAWCKYLESHARKIYGVADDPLAGAKILAKRLHRLPSTFKAKQVSDREWTCLKTTGQLKTALSELVSRNYLREVVTQTGGRPSIDYHINPDAAALAMERDQ